jgi:mannose-6-phosphate isomerase-like protein (cupin superfamily)
LAGVTLTLLATAAVRAQLPPGIDVDWPDDATYWSAAELQKLAADLEPLAQADGRHLAVRPMLATPTHGVLAVHRDATGSAERHEGVTDYWIVTSGEGTLVLGGEIIDPEEIGPGEIRGSSIEGGRKISVKPGDQVDIPPNVPHQILVEPGKSFTYLIIKINNGKQP